MNVKVNTKEEIDSKLEVLWTELTDIPFDETKEMDLVLAEDWYLFPKGTSRDEIWHWFDERHSKGVAWLLYDFGTEETQEKGDE